MTQFASNTKKLAHFNNLILLRFLLIGQMDKFFGMLPQKIVANLNLGEIDHDYFNSSILSNSNRIVLIGKTFWGLSILK